MTFEALRSAGVAERDGSFLLWGELFFLLLLCIVVFCGESFSL